VTFGDDHMPIPFTTRGNLGHEPGLEAVPKLPFLFATMTPVLKRSRTSDTLLLEVIKVHSYGSDPTF
jgi:hypothetical protein